MQVHEIVPEVRVEMHAAEDSLARAIALFRDNGFNDAASDLTRIFAQSRVWTQPKGMLHYLENPDAGEGEE